MLPINQSRTISMTWASDNSSLVSQSKIGDIHIIQINKRRLIKISEKLGYTTLIVGFIGIFILGATNLILREIDHHQCDSHLNPCNEKLKQWQIRTIISTEASLGLLICGAFFSCFSCLLKIKSDQLNEFTTPV